MRFGIRHLLLVMLYVCFGLAALSNIDYPLFATVVKCVVIGTVVASISRCWVEKGESRAFCVGFAIGACLYLLFVYLLFVVVVVFQRRSSGPIYAFGPLRELLLPPGIAYVPWVQATFERCAHYLASLPVGLIGGLASVYFYRRRQQMIAI
jgi:hypothetical protein